MEIWIFLFRIILFYLHISNCLSTFQLNNIWEIFRAPSFLRRGCNCKCGLPPIIYNSNELNGSVLSPSEYPWFVTIQSDEKKIIPGTLINDRYVITAASEVFCKTQASLKVLFGKYDYCDNQFEDLAIKIEKTILYPGFVPMINSNDLALLRLAISISYTPNRIPICLPPSGARYNRLLATVPSLVIHFNNFSEPETFSCLPRKIELPVLPKSSCNRKVYDYEDCLGVLGSCSALCQEDAGAGVTYKTNNGHYELIGILSNKQTCVQSKNHLNTHQNLAIMTTVENYLDWIFQETQDCCYCK